MEEQYPTLPRMWEERARPDFDEARSLARVENTFKQFLEIIFTAAKNAIDKREFGDLRVQITTVAMTIPSQWDLDFQDLVVAHKIDVVFHTEATALAQYISHRCLSAKTTPLIGGMPDIGELINKPNAQCLINCSGYNAKQISVIFVRFLTLRNRDSGTSAFAVVEERIKVGPFDVGVQPGTLCLLIQQSSDEVEEIIENALGSEHPISEATSRAEYGADYRG
ncbi:hypothetical protein diail_3778 [Diaporthe ilicicola]|nr:hypothetical protein diail_3778 [Diaporthe ilicicola]